MCIEMKYLHIVKLVIGDVDNVAFCGLAWSVKGVAKILSYTFPEAPNLEQLSWSPTGLLCRWKDHDHVYIHIDNMKRPAFEGDIGWVVTKRNEGRMTERIWAVFDSKQKAIEYIERQVDEPMFTFKEKCKITEVDGYKPFSKIIGDENPELNRVHFSIYETVIEK
jgi:hypothetical protein